MNVRNSKLREEKEKEGQKVRYVLVKEIKMVRKAYCGRKEIAM